MATKNTRAAVFEEIDGMKNEIIDLTSKLVRIQSVNPLYPGVEKEKVLGGERENNLALKKVLEGFGCKTHLVEKSRKRTNLVGVLKGVGDGRSLILNGHIDTVPHGDPAEWRWGDPVSGKVTGGKVFGRGSTDMKSGIVAMVKAVEAATSAGYRLKGDVIIESVVGEETMDHELGTDAVTQAGYRADAAIVTEPTAPPHSLAVVPVTSGAIGLTVHVEGRPVHVSVRDELIRAGGGGDAVGVNAIEKCIKVIQSLQELEQQWGLTKKHHLFQPGHFTIHPGVINGGPRGATVPYIISDHCAVDYCIIHHPNESFQVVRKEIESYLNSACKLDPWLSKHPPKLEWNLSWPPAEIPKSHPIVRTTASAHGYASGRAAKVHGFAAVSDATFLDKAKIPSVLYGPGDLLLAHGVDEYVETADLVTAAKSLALTVLDWCGHERA